MKKYEKKSFKDRKSEVDVLIKNAEEKIKTVFDTPEQIKELAEYMARFYNYSLRNSLLIDEQFKGAKAVGSYAFWKEKGYVVNKGEKGIKILVPTPLSDRFINEKGEAIPLSKVNDKEKDLIKEGKLEVLAGRMAFKQGYVFDISQTNAKAEDLPKIFPNRWLDGEVKDYDLMYKAMENIAKKIGVKIIEPKEELGLAKGVSYSLTKEVALNPRNTQLQNVKTLIHELTHAKLHGKETRENYSVNEKEFQAELTAYTVCKYFGLDTSEYSFRYISSWTNGFELKDKEKLLNEVKETTRDYIEIIEAIMVNNKELSLELVNEMNLDDRNKKVQVIYSEVDTFKEGNKLEYEEVKELYRESIENAVDERVLELRFIIDKDFDYTDEFLIKKGEDIDLTKCLEKKVDDTLYVKSMIERYLNENDIERKNNKLMVEKDMEINKSNEIHIRKERELEM
ncbi:MULTISPECIES: ArdC-like ssDNA-binding domain-containing protein [Clostridium]|uniref:ArdC-like ssDNA-binding domain-containing protein n=1 Tax=Clostridium TaxID=1485 RepID=UPI000DCFBAD7|nr:MULTISPECIES: ImmA/IrrE family metallo-endopeptidase [Clostridium]MBS5927646.1 ImmA/IrrE family metallo-endopeptidase [Clostridium sp.]MDB2104946.1 ArdC-like ssDNA-binding domain-containing protein [Clostridium paraputrificum]MDU1034186.1 ArdC-like ssDNA-binding domain-containing protein [Clostridium sp.]MDU2108851.1 ArdC-like ssDNA-binding domain-containing protein [Clostridium sp.]MDU3355692.1 ArdC-like ssDNA-binding domain-containing protein [Clostridium sp.]